MKFLKNILKNVKEALALGSSKKLHFDGHPEFEKIMVDTNESKYRKMMKRAYSKLETKLESLIELALNVGYKTTGQDPPMPTRPLETWESTVKQAGRSVVDGLEDEISNLRANLGLLTRKLKKSVRDIVSETHLTRLPELENAILNYLENDRKDTAVLKEQITSLNGIIKNLEAAVQSAFVKLGNKIPVKDFSDSVWVLMLVLGSVVFMESQVIIHAFDALRFSRDTAFTISIALSMFIAYSSFKMASGVVHKDKFDSLFGLLLGAASIGAVAVVRSSVASVEVSGVEMGSAVPTAHGLNLFFLLLNVIFWLFAFVFEKRRQIRQTYFIPKGNLDKLVLVRAELQERLDHIRQVNEKKTAIIQTAYESELLGEAFSELEKLGDLKAKLESRLKSLSDLKARFENGMQLMKEHGEKLFSEYFKKAVRSRRRGANGFQTFTAIALFTALGLGGMGCGQIETALHGSPDYVEVVLINDVSLNASIQNDVHFEKMADFLLEKELGLGLTDPPRTKVEIKFAELGELILSPVIEVASLTEGEPKSTRIIEDRRDEIREFEKEVKEFIPEHFGKGKGMESSQVNQTICRSLNKLSESPASRKIVIVYSDMMQNAGEISFHRRKDLDIAGEDYQKTAKILSEACPLKDLSGIEILVVFSPRKENQEEVLRAQAFWELYFQSHGAKKVRFIPNF